MLGWVGNSPRPAFGDDSGAKRDGVSFEIGVPQLVARGLVRAIRFEADLLTHDDRSVKTGRL